MESFINVSAADLSRYISESAIVEMSEGEEHIITWPMLTGYTKRHISDSVDEIIEDLEEINTEDLS